MSKPIIPDTKDAAQGPPLNRERTALVGHDRRGSAVTSTRRPGRRGDLVTPAQVRAELLRRGLARLGQPGALWLASGAAVALAWRAGPDGAPELAGPTWADVDTLARDPEALALDASDREDALALLRGIARP